MKKEDLKTGMRLKYRNGAIAIVMRDTYLDKCVIMYSTGGWDYLSVLNDNLMNYKYNNDDVIAVYNGSHYGGEMINFKANIGTLLWEREKDIPEYTMEELQEKLGEEFKIKK